MAARPRSLSSASSCILIDVIDIDDDPQDVFEDVVIDLTGDHLSHSLLRDGEVALDRLQARGQTFSPGDVIEVHGAHLGSYSVDFLQVKVIAETRSREPILRGLPLVRTTSLLGKLHMKKNEVCLLQFVERTADDNFPNRPIFLDIRPETNIEKRTLIITNAPYPEHSFSSLKDRIGERTRRQGRAERSGLLACRWRLTVYFARKGRQMRPVEEALESLLAADVPDVQYRVPDEALQNRWHGVYAKGGSWNGGRHAHVDLEAVPREPRTRGHGQKYTFFDAFSSAGGVSRGAQGAGFKVQYAVDNSPEVWDTYRMNFPNATLYRTCIHGFLEQTTRNHVRVDCLHLSPPCQYFSPAHTHDSVHDADNISALFGCGELVKKTRPRIITLEQTFGITHNRHLPYFRALISQMTQYGYSDRKRLVVVAASPGHRLPPFPEATHSETGGGGRKPFTTISQAISGIPRERGLHNVRGVRHFRPPRAPFNSHKLAGTVTTGFSAPPPVCGE
ncbi:c-5 cytosine-specific DNA methylase domain-containing protein [Hirsutella rhossiliensis]|uniref:DNA (cytosine-5-)-methyltransferase n=1 Tax=Hirsutella rhossiliensis TaxID=111463 RepID=A0A9P8N437_9HYPO|nr:c-5 cytosine-specific DNA methylase domain-containing protein [Hirsutella rhossiliensis]KAH0964317.1 c-5 cytosine-specific DNA methylase domain-containing protein [Hirsutella rhossiliensis]